MYVCVTVCAFPPYADRMTGDVINAVVDNGSTLLHLAVNNNDCSYAFVEVTRPEHHTVHIYICINIFIYIYIYKCIYTYMCICISVCICTYTCMNV